MDIEKEYVHNVYNIIAHHFNYTRNQPWPSVQKFIDTFKPGSLIGDIGCGGGVNLETRKDCTFMGCDISSEFVKICKNRGYNVILGDCVKIPYKTNMFDYVLNIAVLPHLSTEEKRLQAIKELVRITKPDGLIYIQVWGYEFNNKNYKTVDKKYDVSGQGVMIPWHLQRRFRYSKECEKMEENKQKLIVYKRYYHLFKYEELENLVNKVDDITIINSFVDKKNYGIIIKKNKL